MTFVLPALSSGAVTNRLMRKVAFVTGTARGQGRAVALLFARAGASVLGADLPGMEEQHEQTAAMARSEGLSFEPAYLDVSDGAQCQAWIDAGVAKHGRIDILYNNAGIAHFASPGEMTEYQWRDTLRGELDVVFYPTKYAWPHLVRGGGGTIINVASVSGMLATPRLPAIAHAAGKGGVIAMTRQYALEGGDHNIRCNSISPGGILTPANRDYLAADPEFAEYWERHPVLHRHGEPEDVAFAALFLASDEAVWITGANLPVDGGMSCRAGVRHQ